MSGQVIPFSPTSSILILALIGMKCISISIVKCNLMDYGLTWMNQLIFVKENVMPRILEGIIQKNKTALILKQYILTFLGNYLLPIKHCHLIYYIMETIFTRMFIIYMDSWIPITHIRHKRLLVKCNLSK
jgi:hypothetical protein